MSAMYRNRRDDEMDEAAVGHASDTDHVSATDYDSEAVDQSLGEALLDNQLWVNPALAPRANPDDPIVRRPPADARGPRPGPDSRGAPGRIAIVQGQVYLVGVILIAQLFLITTALYELLSGRTALLWWLALAQLAGFLIALVIAIWPRQRVRGF
jgi:hypothetical protein